jgi:hypothetical protein
MHCGHAFEGSLKVATTTAELNVMQDACNTLGADVQKVIQVWKRNVLTQVR